MSNFNKILVAIRTATTITENTQEQIEYNTVKLFEEFMQANQVSQEDMVSVIITVTADVNAWNPATALREKLGYRDVAMICLQEAFMENSMQLCIRALIHTYIPLEQQPVHIYQNSAKTLRSDWANNSFEVNN